MDQIIEQLHTYKNALNQMHSSLTSIAVYVESNAGKSLDVWDDTIQQSKKNITSYQAQIDDLLSLFENYVTDTTAYITPISRNSMMRVDRNDIWWNLTQIESGVNNNMFHAILETHKSPSFLFSLFDDPTPEEKERSRHNKQKLDAIRTNIESSKAMLEKNIEGLWDLYETKVKKFENVDDEYSNKASAVKDTYTNFFEGVSDVVSVTVEGVWNFIKGVGVAIYEIAEGLISLVIDAGIIAISNNIPDFIEPEFLKKAANTRVETFAGTLEQIIDDPIIVLESVAQSLSDTSEKEGIMYVTGGAATSLIPYVGQSKYLKLLKVEKDKATNTKAVNPAISQKVKEIVQNNKVFEGIKKETVELYKDIKNGGTRFVDDVTDFLGRTLFPNQTLQMSTTNSMPVNVFSRSTTVEDRIDSVVSRSSVKVEEKGNGDGKGTVKDKGVSETNLRNIDDFINGNKKFDEVIEDFAKVYKEHVDLNKPWSWDDTIPGGDSLSSAQKRKIKEMAIEKGHIPEIKVTKADGMRYGFADFASAGVVEETVQLPERFWKLSDKEQFKWLDEQIGGTRKGMTWHHTEVPGKMELVPFGIHNITPHNGGRTKGMWADAPR
ncbi:HNH endonuclease signature motif containing protein [Bacillus weihaiensis]|uniref:HNH endonuclease signature motif containing protein n=1 Tax=Bacillus weihaiensis TaxID=1547283 RepID=UPI00235517EF|nr:HNH endonuclease [Bacillus weihaiensis]